MNVDSIFKMCIIYKQNQEKSTSTKVSALSAWEPESTQLLCIFLPSLTTGWCDNVHTNQQTTIRSVRTTSPDIKRFCCIYDPKNSANRWTDLVIFFRNSSNRHWKISSILEKENLYKSEAEFKKLYVYKYFDKFQKFFT